MCSRLSVLLKNPVSAQSSFCNGLGGCVAPHALTSKASNETTSNDLRMSRMAHLLWVVPSPRSFQCALAHKDEPAN